MHTDKLESRPSRLILASASPRRSELLQRIGLKFEVHPADVRELDKAAGGPGEMVAVNARLKVEAVAEKFPDALILGSDTTVALGETVLNKPADMRQARAMLHQLSGRTHQVFTSFALRWQQGHLDESFVELAEVRFKQLDDSIIDAYFKRVDPLDKAGAYGIQTGRELIIESVKGSVETVMGLPIEALQTRFSQLGFDFGRSD